MKYACQTMFDITATGITGHYKSTRVPFKDRCGKLITDQLSWDRSRNQQRNFETLIQILSLRCQLTEITDPILDSSGTNWMFEFETETPGAFGDENDPVMVLKQDAQGVPMLRELNNVPDIDSVLVTSGSKQNIWFAAIPINN
jgi:hypothetical protein